MTDPCTTCSDYEPLMPSEVCRTCARRLARRVARLEGLIEVSAYRPEPAVGLTNLGLIIAEANRIRARRQREKGRRG